MKKLLIAGYYTAPILAIHQLFAWGYSPDDIALLTDDDPRNQTLLNLARWNGIEVQTFSCKSDACHAWIAANQFDMLLSLYYRHIIPSRILDLFPGRAVNLHAGLLPQYAGCWSSAWAIINGATHAGFTWHYMTPEIDAGHVIKQVALPILQKDTAYSLYHRMMLVGVHSLQWVMGEVKAGYAGKPQDGERGYYNRQLPFGGYIQPSWDKPQVERFIRAMYFPPWQGALLKLPDGTDKEILSLEQYQRITTNA